MLKSLLIPKSRTKRWVMYNSMRVFNKYGCFVLWLLVMRKFILVFNESSYNSSETVWLGLACLLLPIVAIWEYSSTRKLEDQGFYRIIIENGDQLR